MDIFFNENLEFSVPSNISAYLAVYHLSRQAVMAAKAIMMNQANYFDLWADLEAKILFTEDFEANRLINSLNFNLRAIQKAAFSPIISGDADMNGVTNSLDYNI